MAILKKDVWTEDDVTSFPPGEQPFFERKGGDILSTADYVDVLAKAVCAFANSGGGYLLVGVADDGGLDGVPEIIKRRERAKDWFEKLIPRLLNYPLQDFSVHEVLPSAASKIPLGRVVLVVEVGDSPMAPHQTAASKTYYYRSGGKSEPAPHFFLDLLWGRQKFPGQRVARAWLNAVIRPLRIKLEGELRYLSLPGWPRDVYNRLADGGGGSLFSLHDPTSANQEQFLDFYTDLKELAEQHDSLIAEIYESSSRLEEAVRRSRELSEAYRRSVSPESLQKLRDIHSKQYSNYPIDADLIDELFGNKTEEKHIETLAMYVVWYFGEVEPTQARAARVWNFFREEFVAVLDAPGVRDYHVKLTGEGDALKELAATLLTEIKNIRRQLSMRYSEPFEDLGGEKEAGPFRSRLWE